MAEYRRQITVGVVVVVVVTLALAVGISYLPLNQANGGTSFTSSTTPGTTPQGLSTVTSSSTSVPVQIPGVVFGLSPPNVVNESRTYALSPNAFVWETFSISQPVKVSLANYEMIIPNSSYSSKLWVGVYLNGAIAYQKSYNVSGIGSPDSNVTASMSVNMNDSTLVAGSEVSVAILTTGLVYLFLPPNGSVSGNAYVLNNQAQIPQSLPYQAYSSGSMFYAWGSYG